MRCSNCEFFNMPGSDICGRCGSTLRPGAAISVMPPRATPMRKRLRQILPARRIYHSTASALQSTIIPQRAIDHIPPPATVALFVRAAVPGRPHFVRQQRLRGHLFLWSWIAFLILGLLLIGSTTASILLGLAFSIHSSAMADIINQELPHANVREKMGRGLAVSAMLFVLIYWPARLLMDRYAAPFVLQTAMAPFLPGDVVLVRESRPPTVGDIVLYDLEDYHDYIGLHEGRRFDVINGSTIDRILAGPGDKISGKAGIFMVNQTPGRYKPLNPMRYPDNFSFVVPSDSFLIMPSGAPNLNQVENSVDWTRFIFVPRSSITGQVYVQTQPLSRFRFFH